MNLNINLNESLIIITFSILLWKLCTLFIEFYKYKKGREEISKAEILLKENINLLKNNKEYLNKDNNQRDNYIG